MSVFTVPPFFSTEDTEEKGEHRESVFHTDIEAFSFFLCVLCGKYFSKKKRFHEDSLRKTGLEVLNNPGNMLVSNSAQKLRTQRTKLH
jgi:hypothetical protein